MSYFFKSDQGYLEIIEAEDLIKKLSQDISGLIDQRITELELRISSQKQDRLFNTKEAAKYIGYSESSLRRYIKEGRLSCIKIGENSMRFKASELDSFLEKHSTNKSA